MKCFCLKLIGQNIDFKYKRQYFPDKEAHYKNKDFTNLGKTGEYSYLGCHPVSKGDYKAENLFTSFTISETTSTKLCDMI